MTEGRQQKKAGVVMDKIFVGIDLGGTNIKLGIINSAVKLLCKTAVATNADMGPEIVVDNICNATLKLLADNKLALDDVGAAGIGTPGPINIAEGIVISASNLPGFHNVPLRELVSEKLGKPTVFENDANAACWGQYVAGAGKGISDMVFFTLGTGIGGGIVLDGELMHGCDDNAAELGHAVVYPDGRQCNCGQRGCVETYASATAIAARTTEAIEAGAESSLKKILDEKGSITCKDVYDHLKNGDALAKKITDEAAKALALICINMVHTTDPQRIVFSGGVIAAGDVLLNRIRDYFDQYIWSMKAESVEICFATIGEDTGIIGAAALALHAFQQGHL